MAERPKQPAPAKADFERDTHVGIPQEFLCPDLDVECVDCGGTGEFVRPCPRCKALAMRARLDRGGFSGLPIIGRKCDDCGLVEPPTYLRKPA